MPKDRQQAATQMARTVGWGLPHQHAGDGKNAEDREQRTENRGQRTASSAVVCLKGAGTVVTDGTRVYINTTGNPGMATAGSGDVLTGIILALLGQFVGAGPCACPSEGNHGGLPLLDATILGVYVHGLAGDLAAARLGQVSLIATDLIDALPEAFK